MAFTELLVLPSLTGHCGATCTPPSVAVLGPGRGVPGEGSVRQSQEHRSVPRRGCIPPGSIPFSPCWGLSRSAALWGYEIYPVNSPFNYWLFVYCLFALVGMNFL